MAVWHSTLLPLFILAAVVTNAQQLFEWSFTGNRSNEFPSCATLSLAVNARIANGIPPYYMIAFAVHETPTTSLLGMDENNLTWTVAFPFGTQLLLGVVDSEGNSGGIDSVLYTVVHGPSTSCLPEPTTENAFTLTANVTDSLSTCESWGLTIDGGVPPYTITIAAMDSAQVLNETVATDLDKSIFTWINTARPGSDLIGVSASDAHGRWATGTILITTEGSSNTACIAEIGDSVGGEPDVRPAVPNSSFVARRSGTVAIVGVSVAALLVLCALVLVLPFCRRLWRPRDTIPHIDPFLLPVPSAPSTPIQPQQASAIPSRYKSHRDAGERPPPPPSVNVAPYSVLYDLPPPYA